MSYTFPVLIVMNSVLTLKSKFFNICFNKVHYLTATVCSIYVRWHKFLCQFT